MSDQSYIQSILQSLNPEKSSATSLSFIEAIAHQLRSPFRSRYSPEHAANLLKESWEMVSCRADDTRSLILTPTEGSIVMHLNISDQPFIVDTIRMQLSNMGCTNISGYNAVLPISRDEKGKLKNVDQDNGKMESIIRFDIEGLDSTVIDTLHTNLTRALTLSKAMVEDFKNMTDILESITLRFLRKADRVPDKRIRYQESFDFLNWLLQDNFVFMGLKFDNNQYGFLRDEHQSLWDSTLINSWNPPNGLFPVAARKGGLESPVHRRGQIDEIQLQVPSDRGAQT